MLKIKFVSVLFILLVVGIVLSNSRSFSTSARGDLIAEIAAYKTWTKITKEPIKVEFAIDFASGGG